MPRYGSCFRYRAYPNFSRTAVLVALPGARDVSKGQPEGVFELAAADSGPPLTSDGWQHTALYLQGNVDLDLAGLSLGLGVDSGPLRFVPADGQSPTLVDTAITGNVAAAWLNG